MAIDTVADRFSMMDMGGIESPAIIIPTGGVEVHDRLHLLWLYGGLAAAVALVIETPDDRRILFMAASRVIYYTREDRTIDG